MADRYQNRPQMADDNLDRGRQRPADTESNPLAELARLIGQTDPQSNFARGRPASGTPQASRSLATDFAAGPPSWVHTAQANLQPTEIDDGQGEADAELTPMPSFLQGQHPQAQYQAPQQPAVPHQGASRYDGVLYGQQHEQYDDQQQDDQQAYQDEEYSDEALTGPPSFLDETQSRRRSGGVLTVAVVVGLAVVGTAGAYAYRSYTGSPRSGDAPVIKADTSPSKVVPPTQASDGSGKLIYDRIGGGGPEKVVSREEQPVDVSGTSTRVAFPPLNQTNAPATRGVGTVGTPPAAGQTANNDSTAGDEPRKIRTVPIRSDQAGTAQAKTAAPPPTTVRTVPVQAPAPAGPSGNAPIQLTPNAVTTSVRSASAAAPPASTTAAPTNVTPRSGGYLVQIASQKSEADAQASYRAAQAKFANLLGSMSPLIKRADLGDKGVFYRALVGPFASSDEATKLCSNLKIAGGTCLIQRN